MRTNAVILASFLIPGLLAGACSSSIDRATAPTTASPDEAVGSTPPATRTPPPQQPPLPPPASGSCIAVKAQSVIGQRASQQLLESARVAAEASTARFIRPNEPITTEFNGSRLNLQLNEQDVVRAVSCG